MSLLRSASSRVLNFVYRNALGLPYRDLSSGFRLYRSTALDNVAPAGVDFDFLPELLVRMHAEGFRIRELPFHYRPRRGGKSHAKLLRFGWAFLRTMLRMRRLRNSVLSADYDDRAFDSIIVPQRYWQRKRFEIIMSFVDQSQTVLDVGCGSGRVVQSLPSGVGVDLELR